MTEISKGPGIAGAFCFATGLFRTDAFGGAGLEEVSGIPLVFFRISRKKRKERQG
ncbi:hypothetical protein ACSBLW_17580 [Thioclava sp. FR2]|uniref:hypothetical protein n=1 Tax=Thioclava sp. FR2 TaxID=3445780 RepID=UPI003EC0838B